MAVSVFDLFKVGIGPSSSHTVGPMRAARRFTQALADHGLISHVCRIRSELFGSLGATGKGHGSDSAVLLGLAGHEPDTVDVDRVGAMIDEIQQSGVLLLGGTHRIVWDEQSDLRLVCFGLLGWRDSALRIGRAGGPTG